jgi:hypothetical protein
VAVITFALWTAAPPLQVVRSEHITSTIAATPADKDCAMNRVDAEKAERLG